jgi:DNA-binding MarR family transcriptional regulator
MMKPMNLTTYRAGLLQARAYRRLKAFMTEQLESYNVTMMQWTLLGHIHDYSQQEGVRTNTLAGIFDVQTSLMTNMVNDLEKQNLVYRSIDPDDSRARRIRLTDEGIEFVDEVEQKIRAAMKEWLGDINRKHLQHYLYVTRILAEEK